MVVKLKISGVNTKHLAHTTLAEALAHTTLAQALASSDRTIGQEWSEQNLSGWERLVDDLIGIDHVAP